MSDFDKEAEREKLREKLEREEENREATQHMSELLLKGATMTNRHCEECGDPIFRHEGREFCPTCGAEVAGEAGEESGATADEASAPDTDAGAADAGAADAGTSTAARREATRAPDAGGEPASAGDGMAEAGGADRQAAAGGAPAGGAAAEGLDAARAALVRKLVGLARQAEATDDVSRSRELLAAAREAAEALAAVEEVR